jgi:HSP20 family molecular chaperone IbpA
MSAVTRQDPWGVMPRLQDEINRLFGNARENDSSSATAMWIPLVDIHEYVDRVELYVDLPGVDPAKVELTLDGGILEKVNATGNHGVLTVTIPKQPKAMPRRIQIGS